MIPLFLQIIVESHLLASSLSKVLERSILLTWGQHFTTSNLQFGFKSGYSTTLCTGALKAIISHYLNSGSRVHACFIDASKAFDVVNHRILFEKLLSRRMPKPLICLLLQWHKSQQLCVRWMCRSSTYFQVSNGMQQGGGSESYSLHNLYGQSSGISQGQWKRLLLECSLCWCLLLCR